MTAAAAPRSIYIAGRAYDWTFFLLQPLIALGLGMAISDTAFAGKAFEIDGKEVTWAGVAVGALTHAHLVAVFFRTHGNPAIFRLHRVRFVLVPVLLWAGILWSSWIAVIASVLGTFWDVWHSGLQTFGLARIYDRNRGNPPAEGRRLDYWLNHLMYAGPILAGATMLDHFEHFGEFESVGAEFLTSIPARMEGSHRAWTWAVVGGGTLYLAYYLFAYWRLYRRGHRFSVEKVFLLATTGFCSIYTWGFNTWGEAFFIMNFFHAVQYLALVWTVERPRITALFRMSGRPAGAAIALGGFLLVVSAYGIGAKVVAPGVDALWAIAATVSLMHFWYDGFVWSVARGEV